MDCMHPRIGRTLARVAAGLVVAAGAAVLATPAHAEGDPPAPVSAATLTPPDSAVPAPVPPEVPVATADLAPVAETGAAVPAEALAQAAESIREQRAAAMETVRNPVISPRNRPSVRPSASAAENVVSRARTTTSAGQYHAPRTQYHEPRRAAPAAGGRAQPRSAHSSSIERAIQRMKRLQKAGRICPQNLAGCDPVCPSDSAANATNIEFRIAYCPSTAVAPPDDTTCGAPNLPGDPVDTETQGDTADSNGDIACGGEPSRPASSTGSPETAPPAPDAPPVQTTGPASAPPPTRSAPSARARTEISVRVAAARPAAPVRVAVAASVPSNDVVPVRPSVHRRHAVQPSRPSPRRAARSQVPLQTERASSLADRPTAAIVRSAARSGTSDDSVRRSFLMLAALALLALLLATASTASNAGGRLVAIRARLGSKGLSSRRIVLGNRLPGRDSAEIRYRE
jgi:hypothetical protein